MPLFDAKARPNNKPVALPSNIAAKIQQRRYQILVHSLIYYELDMNLVSDAKWTEWAMELVDLQKKYPDVADSVIFAKAFKDFDGSTGFDLPYCDEQIVNIAYRLLWASNDADAKDALNRIRQVRVLIAEYDKLYSHTPERQPIQSQRKAVKKNEPAKRKKLF